MQLVYQRGVSNLLDRRLVYDNIHQRDSINQGIRPLRAKLSAELYYEKLQQTYLLASIWAYKDQECDDVRDHVFGLLALVNESLSPRAVIRADYSKTPAEVYEDVMKTIERDKYGRIIKDWWEYGDVFVGELREMLGLPPHQI